VNQIRTSGSYTYGIQTKGLYNETLNAVTKAAALPVAPADGTVSEVPSNLSSFASGVPPYLSLGISLLAFGAFYVFSRK